MKQGPITSGVAHVGYCTKKNSPHLAMGDFQKKGGATSPTWCKQYHPGADGLNFPVPEMVRVGPRRHGHLNLVPQALHYQYR